MSDFGDPEQDVRRATFYARDVPIPGRTDGAVYAEATLGFPVVRPDDGIGRYPTAAIPGEPRRCLTTRDVLDAIDAMTRDELDRLRRRVAGVPERSPVLFVPDGRGGYQDPEFGSP